MKKKLFLIFLLLNLPVFVNADTLKVGENSYSIDKLENPCVKANLVLDSYDEKGAICLDPADNFTNLYRVDASGTKKEFTNQDYLDFYNKFDYTHYTFFNNENIIYKVSGNNFPGYVEVPYDQIDTNKIYTIITDEGNGSYSYSYTDEPGFVFDPALKYYEEVNLALPKNADVKTDGSITYYACAGVVQICSIVKEEDIKAEDVLSYYVKSDKQYKEEKVATINAELFEKIKAPKEGVSSQNYNIYKLPGKDVYYIFYEEETSTGTTIEVYTHDGQLVFENIDTFGVINVDLIYTIEDENVVIYNTNKEVLKTIPGKYLYKLYNIDNRTIFASDDTLTTIYEIKKLANETNEETTTENNKSEDKQIIDITNPDTGDTIISSLVIGGISLIGIIAITMYKRKEN